LYLNKYLSVVSDQYQNQKLLFRSTFYVILHCTYTRMVGKLVGLKVVLQIPYGIWGISTYDQLEII
jgi:hypothetical protein